MKVVKKKGENGALVLDVTASTSEVSEALNNASIQFCQQMQIRPMKGKTPAQAASEQMGIKDLDSVVQQQAIDALVPFALDKHAIIPAFMPVAQPKSLMKRGRTFQFALEVVPKPHYELSSYDPVSITVQPMGTNEAAIDAEINGMSQRYTTYVATDPCPFSKGVAGLLAIAVSQNGEPIKGLTTEARTYVMGEGYMPEGFDAGLEGMEPGETRTFTFTGPDMDEDGNMVEKEYEATVTLKEIQKEIAPVIDDEWVSKNMPIFKSLEELRADIGKRVDVTAKLQYDDYVRNTAAAELSKRFQGKIEDEVYEGAMRELQQRVRQQVAQSGQTWDQFVEQQGGEQQLSMMFMMETRQTLVQGFALDALYRHENLQYSDTELDEVCRAMNPQNPRVVRNHMEKAGFGYSLREAAERLTAAKFLVEHADIKLAKRDSEE